MSFSTQILRRTRLFKAAICFAILVILSGTAVAQEKNGDQTDLKGSKKAENQGPEKRIRRPDQKITSFVELCEAYAAQKIKFRRNDENQTLIFQTKKTEIAGFMIVKWDQSNGVVHFIQSLPRTLKREQVNLYLKVCQRLNHAFLFPGLGANLDNLGIYYRFTVPVAPRGFLFDYEVGTYTKFTLNKAAEFLPTINAALDQKITEDEVILYHKKYLKKLLAEKKQTLVLGGKFARSAFGSNWVLDFTKPGVVSVSVDGKVGVVSQYQIEGNKVSLTDLEGKLAAKEIGVYQAFVSNGRLTFKVEKDPVTRRSDLLSRGPWTLQK